MIKKVFLVFILLLHFSCDSPHQDQRVYEKYADRVSSSFSHAMALKYDLRVESLGGPSSSQIEGFNFDFRLNRRAYEEEVLELLVTLTEEFLIYGNADKSIRPYLLEYPMGIDMVSMMISIPKLHPKFVTEGSNNFRLVSLVAGKVITYYEHSVKEESYEDLKARLLPSS